MILARRGGVDLPPMAPYDEALLAAAESHRDVRVGATWTDVAAQLEQSGLQLVRADPTFLIWQVADPTFLIWQVADPTFRIWQVAADTARLGSNVGAGRARVSAVWSAQAPAIVVAMEPPRANSPLAVVPRGNVPLRHVSQAEQGVANDRLQQEAEANFYRNITTAAAAPRGGGTRGKWAAAAQPRQLGARRSGLPHQAR